MKYLFFLLLFIPLTSFSNNTAKNEKAKTYGKSLCTSLWLFKLDMRRYPTNEEGLIKLLEPKNLDNGATGKSYLTQIESDPWGNQYQYFVNNENFKLWSMGPDGLSNNKDDVGPNICK